MDQIIVALVNILVVPFANAVPFLVSSGILLLAFAVLWAAFGVALVRSRPSLDRAWARIRRLPLPVEAIVWLLFLPVLVGLWIWRTRWPLVARLALIVGLAGWNLLVMLPQPSSGVSSMNPYPAILFAAAAAGLAYAAVLRPRISHWGATDEEVAKPLPGDEVPSPYGYRQISTRAITVDAPPEEVWPWIVQMGSGRAGFYTHEWVERLLGLSYAEGHSATRIHPEWQELHVGDKVPYSRFNEVVVMAVEPPRYLMAGEWLVLERLDDGKRTRLIARTRGAWLEYIAGTVPVFGPLLRPVAGLIDRGPGELLHHYMESGMLKGIKGRVEAASMSRSSEVRSAAGATVPGCATSARARVSATHRV